MLRLGLKRKLSSPGSLIEELGYYQRSLIHILPTMLIEQRDKFWRHYQVLEKKEGKNE